MKRLFKFVITATLLLAVLSAFGLTAIAADSIEDIVSAANEQLSRAVSAQSDYIDAGGKKTDSVYTYVSSTKASLQVYVSASVKSASRIQSYTATLKTRVDALENATALLKQTVEEAVSAANAELQASALAKQQYLAAGGLASDYLYKYVIAAETALQKAISANPQVKTTIQTTTSMLASKRIGLQAAAEKLILVLEGAVNAANDKLGLAATELQEYLDAGGLSTDLVYSNTVLAKSALEAKLSQQPQNAAAIKTATSALTSKLSSLSSAKRTLLYALNAAITVANAEISKANTAQKSYIDAGGFETDEVYINVSSAIAFVQEKLNATPSNKNDILSAAKSLTASVNLLNAAKTIMVSGNTAAITAAKAQIVKAASAATAYISAGGSKDDQAYAELMAAKTALEELITKLPCDRTAITEATAALSVKIDALNAAKDAVVKALAASVSLANSTISSATAGLSAYILAGGSLSDAVYTDVMTAKTALAKAVAIRPQVKMNIDSLTAALSEKLTLLSNAKDELIAQTKIAAEQAAALIKTAEQALADYIYAGGRSTSSVYTNVLSAKASLASVIANTRSTKAAITASSSNLQAKLDLLEAARQQLLKAKQDAIDAAGAEIQKAESCLSEYLLEGGAASDKAYADVVSAKEALTAALAEDPVVTLKVTTLTTALAAKDAALKNATLTLAQTRAAAIAEANAVLATVQSSKSNYLSAGGYSEDAVYTAVDAAKLSLEEVLGSGTKIIEQITAATNALTSALKQLNDVTAALINGKTAALSAANTAVAKVPAALAAYISAGGNAQDTVYIIVNDAKAALQLLIDAADSSTLSLIEKTQALNTALTELESAKNVLLKELADAAAAANASILKVSAAQTAYIKAGGLNADALYTDVTAAKLALSQSLLARPQVKQTILELTADLEGKLSKLTSRTDELLKLLADAITAANLEFERASQEMTAYLAAGGSSYDVEYKNVYSAKAALSSALASTAKTAASVSAASQNLAAKTDALVIKKDALTAAFNKAIEDANNLISLSESLQSDYVTLGGKTTDRVYTDVTAAITYLRQLLSAGTKTTATVNTRTLSLKAKYDLLSTAKDALQKQQDEAVLAAQSKLSSADDSLRDYLAAGGIEADSAYAVVLEAKTALENALSEKPRSTSKIAGATNELSARLTGLETAKNALLKALEDAVAAATLEISKADTAAAAYIAAGGSADDMIYKDLSDASNALKAALNSIPKMRKNILDAISILTAKINAIGSATDALVQALEQAVAAAQDEIAKADVELAAYITAGGSQTDAVYTEALTAKTALATLIAAQNKSASEIIFKTTALSARLAALHDATSALTKALADAVAAANDLISKAAAKLAAYVAAEGSTSDSVYSDVTQAKDALSAALSETPKNTTRIINASALLQQRYTALDAATASLLQMRKAAIDAAQAELDKIQGALTAYTAVGGKSTDKVYTDTVSAADALRALLAQDPPARQSVIAATDTLKNTLSALNAAAETLKNATAAAKEAAAAMLSEVPNTLAAYIQACGSEDDQVYKDVLEAQAALVTTVEQALTADEINAAIDLLQSKINILKSAAEALSQSLAAAVKAAGDELAKVDGAAGEYILAGGNSADGVYIDLTCAKEALEAALSETVQNRQDIVSKTAVLKEKLAAILAAAQNLNTSLDAAVKAANEIIAKAAAAQLSYKAAGGNETDTAYADLVLAKSALQNLLSTTKTSEINAAAQLLSTKADELSAAGAKLVSDAVKKANEVIAQASLAKQAYISSGGSLTDTVCKDVDTVVLSLQSAISEVPCNSTKVIARTSDLTDKISSMEAARAVLDKALSDAVAKAQQELDKVSAALSAYIAAGGSSTDTVYANTVSAKTALASALAENPRSTSKINSAANALTNSLSALSQAAAQLADQISAAVISANEAITASVTAQIGYTAAGGSALDAEYKEVSAARALLDASLTAEPKVLKSIVDLTSSLSAKIKALSDAAAALATKYEAAVAAANAACASAQDTLTAYIASGGILDDANYLTVADAKTAVQSAITAKAGLADLSSLTTALNNKITSLKAIIVINLKADDSVVACIKSSIPKLQTMTIPEEYKSTASLIITCMQKAVNDSAANLITKDYLKRAYPNEVAAARTAYYELTEAEREEFKGYVGTVLSFREMTVLQDYFLPSN